MWRVLAASIGLLLAGCIAAPAQTGALPDGASTAGPLPSGGALGAGQPPTASAASLAAWPSGVHRVTLDVGGEPATGLLAVPEGDPVALAVLAHGWGHDAEAHRGDLEALRGMGAAAIAMDFRGDQGAFKVRAGVEDTNAAAAALHEAHPGRPMLLYGWSMGGEVALLAVLAAPPGTYDHVFVGAGVSDLESFWEAVPLARPAIEQEAGGPPAAVPDAYAARSPARHGASLAAAGVRHVFLVHGVGDPVVPVDHAERTYQALAAAGQPVSLYLMGRGMMPGSCTLPDACVPPLPSVAGHEAGAFHYLRPFVQHRIEGLADPGHHAAHGTYDGWTGQYEPSDVGP